ncbi:uncharacterized protein LOC119779540 isoform X2 [Cyprinodon tularosa]|uniref:uncharacterized protein LOC119779540 isoform X2 n=1 Tax=Cyprinodon tularosa TaxID=77115 RepID=UPI0018E26EBB|nr:uncharacterized protein LOC119779540 isoform X2 [Cyprinodon tularosa]
MGESCPNKRIPSTFTAFSVFYHCLALHGCISQRSTQYRPPCSHPDTCTLVYTTLSASELPISAVCTLQWQIKTKRCHIYLSHTERLGVLVVVKGVCQSTVGGKERCRLHKWLSNCLAVFCRLIPSYLSPPHLNFPLTLAELSGKSDTQASNLHKEELQAQRPSGCRPDGGPSSHNVDTRSS